MSTMLEAMRKAKLVTDDKAAEVERKLAAKAKEEQKQRAKERADDVN